MSQKKVACGFLFLLVIYLLVCVFFAQRPLENDEGRYYGYAVNLTKGFYAQPETKHLWNGPGYPLFVSLFILCKIPVVAAKYCNALFLLGAVVFFYRTLRFYMDSRKAFGCAMVFGLYPPLLPELPRLLTESMSVFLMTGFVYCTVRAYKEKEVRTLVAACLCGGALILTKVVFAYVVTLSVLVLLAMSVWRRDFLRSAAISLGCLGVCLPYLLYTHSLTGKWFYWANSGGTALHCMSNPDISQMGDWFHDSRIFADERLSPHRSFAESLKDKDYVEKDILFKKKAFENIRRHPHKYLANWLCNVGRMWFNYPFAYKYQRPHTLVYTFPNALLLSAVLFSVFPLLRSARRLPPEIGMMGIFAVLFIGGSSLIYTCSRYLVPVVPVLLLLVFYCWVKVLEIHFRDPLEHR